MRPTKLLWTSLLLPVFPSLAQSPVRQAAEQAPKNLPPWVMVVEWESHWQVSAGAQWRSLGSVDWQTGSYSLGAAAGLINPLIDLPRSAAGPPRGVASRTYRDGYVRPDASTPIDGLTEVWGFASDSQVLGDSLLLHSMDYESELIREQRQGDWNERAEGTAGFIALDWQAVRKDTPWGTFRAGVQGAVSLLPMEFENKASTVSATLVERQYPITDRYSLDGLIAPLGPYSGTAGGGGPVIDATPDGRSEGARRVFRERHFENVIQQELEVLLTSVSIGPTLAWEGHADWAVSGSLGLALNVVSWEASQREVFLMKEGQRELAVWNDSDEGTDVLAGFYLQIAAQRRLASQLWLQIMGRYDWTGALREQVGPSSFELDLSGWTVGIALVWRF